MDKKITKAMVYEALLKEKKHITASALAKKMGVYSQWNTVERYLYQLDREDRAFARKAFIARENFIRRGRGNKSYLVMK